MAVNTVSGQAILFKIARDVGELKSAFITGVTNPTTFACAGLTEDTNDFYKNALGRLQGGSTYARVTGYTGSTKTFVTSSSPDLSPSTSNLFQLAWWNADKRGAAWEAINEAIRASYPFWYREVVTEAASSGITLAAGDDDYDLPAACDALLAIGVGANPIYWIPAVEEDGRENYRIEGQAGAFVLRLMPRYSRNGSIADEWNGQNIALHYATREPELTAETSLTQLPLDYFWVASENYLEGQLPKTSRVDLALANVNIPQVQQAAQLAIQKLNIGKKPPSLLTAQEVRETRNENGKK
jgi:hypothetical protein